MSHGHEPIGIGDRAMDRRLLATAALNVAITAAELLGGLPGRWKPVGIGK